MRFWVMKLSVIVRGGSAGFVAQSASQPAFLLSVHQTPGVSLPTTATTQ
ncbi:unnamed protein product, partial [Gulo gulo]